MLQRFKTDQEGETKTLACPTAPTRQRARCGPGEHGRSWQAWRPVPAFRAITRHGRIAATRLGDRAVARRSAAGHSPRDSTDISPGHSLSAGFATEAYAQGAPELAVMRHGRWRSATVMRGYVEGGSLWNDNAAARLGL